jgi:hypothetical protein
MVSRGLHPLCMASTDMASPTITLPQCFKGVSGLVRASPIELPPEPPLDPLSPDAAGRRAVAPTLFRVDRSKGHVTGGTGPGAGVHQGPPPARVLLSFLEREFAPHAHTLADSRANGVSASGGLENLCANAIRVRCLTGHACTRRFKRFSAAAA